MKIPGSNHVYFYLTETKGKKVYGSNTTVIKGYRQIIIDPGTEKDKHLAGLKRLMEKDGIFLEDTDEIWITHAHPDHIIAVGRLVKELNCRVCCHPLSVAMFESPSPIEYYSIQMVKAMNKVNMKILSQVFKSFPWFPKKLKIKKAVIPRTVNTIRIIEPFLRLFVWLPSFAVLVSEKILKKSFGNLLSVKIHMVFSNGQRIKNGPIEIQTIFCPGHAPDEAAFYLPKEKILITGDLIKVQRDGKSKNHLPFIPVLNSQSSNFGEALSSAEKLKKLEIKTMIPAHRGYIAGEKRIKGLLYRMAKDMREMKSMVKSMEKEGIPFREISRRIVETLSEKYPHCSRQEKITCAYLLLKHLNGGK